VKEALAPQNGPGFGHFGGTMMRNRGVKDALPKIGLTSYHDKVSVREKALVTPPVTCCGRKRSITRRRTPVRSTKSVHGCS